MSDISSQPVTLPKLESFEAQSLPRRGNFQKYPSFAAFLQEQPEIIEQLFARQSAFQNVAHRAMSEQLLLRLSPQDIVQGTISNIISRQSPFEYRSLRQVASFIISAIHTEIRDRSRYYRAQKRSSGMEQPTSPEFETMSYLPDRQTENPLDSLVREEQRELIHREIDGLQPVTKKLLLAWLTEESSFKEIASEYGLPSVGAAEMRNKRALKVLQVKLQRALGHHPLGEESSV